MKIFVDGQSNQNMDLGILFLALFIELFLL